MKDHRKALGHVTEIMAHATDARQKLRADAAKRLADFKNELKRHPEKEDRLQPAIEKLEKLLKTHPASSYSKER